MITILENGEIMREGDEILLRQNAHPDEWCPVRVMIGLPVDGEMVVRRVTKEIEIPPERLEILYD